MDSSPANASEATVLEEQGSTIVVFGLQGSKTRCKPEHIRQYDFRQPPFLAPTELRKLRQRHDEFARSLAARLSMYLRFEVALRVTKLQTVCYQTFTESLGVPTHVSLFKAEPLKGICLLDIPARLGLTMVDRLLGGTSQAQTETRELTEIETALLDQVVRLIVNEWCSHWQAFEHLNPVVLAYENNGRFLQTAPHDTVMIYLAMEARLGDCIEPIQIAFPHYALEPLVKYLTALNVGEKDSASASAAAPARWNAELDNVAVGVTAEWNGLRLSVRELAALKPGDVLMLDPQVTGSVQVCVAAAAKYSGRLGTRGKNWAVELTQRLIN